MADFYYITKQDEMLDQICNDHYGFTESAVEKVLKLNPNLSKQPPILPMGLLIKLPKIEKSKINEVIRLYG